MRVPWTLDPPEKTDMPIRIQCGQCGAKLTVANRKAGMTIRCPGCQAEIAVPVAGPAVLAAAAVGVAGTGGLSPPAHWDDDEPEEDEGFSIRAAETELDEMDLTPMVDVTFLLLIFFMITASFTIQKTLKFPAPERDEDAVSPNITTDPEDLREAAVFVDVDENNVITVEEKPVTDISALADIIAQEMRAAEPPKTEVLITRHYYASHEVTVVVVDASKDAGVNKIRIGITPGSQPEK